jgi:DNA-binding ferritin-like protein
LRLNRHDMQLSTLESPSGFDVATDVTRAYVEPSRARQVQPQLARLVTAESTLYATTREWRYDPRARKFIQLQATLAAQFSAIGRRLAQLAERSRTLGGWASTSRGDRAPGERAHHRAP